MTSHTLEHVLDDEKTIEELRKSICEEGILAVYVPIEEPDYIPFHIRNYSLQSITTKIASSGFTILHVEPSMFINGHIWKILTIPSRKNWPAFGKVVNFLRLLTLSLIPYPMVKFLDTLLYKLGFGARQALVVARKRKPE